MKLSDFKHGTIVKIGSTNYRLYRLEQFAGGLLGTMTRFPRLQECEKRGDHWWDIHTKTPNYSCHWNQPCELVDDSNTAVAGEVFDTRVSPVVPV